MSEFLLREKPKQAKFKSSSPYYSSGSREEGIYRGHFYPFCLPRTCAHENLYSEIREPILEYFARNQIKWHDGQDGKPSNHMCDSQVCCANFLFPFYNKPDALAELLRPIFPSLKEMHPIEDGQFVAFEWIGKENYLGEVNPNNRKRSRGANFTSADAAVMFRHFDGRKQIVLIEWKYTESYFSTSLIKAKSGRYRTTIYADLYNAEDCPLLKELVGEFERLFYEPFYQLMRQQFLAHGMEKAHELGADIVSLLHLSPAHNQDFLRITSPGLKDLDSSAIGVWQKLVKVPGRFTGCHIEVLFGNFDVRAFPELCEWWQYLTSRYSWDESRTGICSQYTQS
jgi:hypothetical protein